MIWLSHRFVWLMNFVAPLFGRTRVPTICTDELVRLLDRDDESFVLVDARSDAESAVSMIPGAIARDDFESRRAEFSGRTVIAYCTAGGRSLLFAQQCASEGFEVRNYRESILGWCAAGRPLARPGGEPTNRVHTHNRLFHVPQEYERVY